MGRWTIQDNARITPLPSNAQCIGKGAGSAAQPVKCKEEVPSCEENSADFGEAVVEPEYVESSDEDDVSDTEYPIRDTPRVRKIFERQDDFGTTLQNLLEKSWRGICMPK